MTGSIRVEGRRRILSLATFGRRVFPTAVTPWAWLVNLGAAAGWLGAASYMAFIAARIYRPDSQMIFIWFNSYTFWLYMPVYGVALFAGVFRRWFLLLAAGTVIAFHLAWVLPDYRPAASISAEAREAPSFTLMTTNVFFGNEDYAGIAAEILEVDPDVVFLQEFGPRVQIELEASGVQDRFPYRQIGYENRFYGNAIYSKVPLKEVGVIDAGTRPLIRATVEINGHDLHLYNVHPTSPGLGDGVAGDWNEDLKAISEIVDADDGLLVVAGDFNMNQHHRWYRELKDDGLVNSHEERGRGNATTWPKGRKLRPIRIDNVFHSPGITTLSVREGNGEGSDHRPVIVELAVIGQ